MKPTLKITPNESEWTLYGKARRAVKELNPDPKVIEDFDIAAMSARSLRKFVEARFECVFEK